jgi:hypothetical protein
MCLGNPCDPKAACHKTGPGTFVCACLPGYEGNGFSCSELDPCKSNPCDVHANCRKLGPNKAQCTCEDGYVGNGYSCKEFDPCEKDPCDPHAVCYKTGPGAHTCVCKPGYRQNPLETLKCDEIDPCQDYPCDPHATCKKTRPGAFVCNCNTGFVQDGNKCLEINSCSKVPAPCHVDAKCLRTGPGTHVCMCAVGYEGDGVKSCTIKPGWEDVVKPTPLGQGVNSNVQIGPDGVPVLVDSQQQKDLRAKLEEETARAAFAQRERQRTRRISELQSRILEYEEMRRHRKIAEDNETVRQLEKRVEKVAASSAAIAAQKDQQLHLLKELKQFEADQEKALKDLVNEKSQLVLDKAREEARRLAKLARKRPNLPSLDLPANNDRPRERQNYRDGKGPKPLAGSWSSKAPMAVRPTDAPLVAGNSDLPGQDAGNHASPAEAAWVGAQAAEIAV